MKNGKQQAANGSKGGFTLIELLMVITIIGILAGLGIGVMVLAGDNAKRKRVQTQIKQIEVAIERYHAKHGFYPPDSRAGYTTNQLFYELTGTVLAGNQVLDIDGKPIDLKLLGIGGIVNCSKNPNTPPKNFFGDSVKTVDIGGVRLLQVPVDWPNSPVIGPDGNEVPPPLGPGVTENVWHYVSTNPKYNKNSFDLWTEIVLRKKVIRVSNWEKNK